MPSEPLVDGTMRHGETSVNNIMWIATQRRVDYAFHMTHAEIIAKLGNTRAVAQSLGVDDRLVSNWKTRGIPWRWRQQIKDMARRKKLSLPTEFMRERGA